MGGGRLCCVALHACVSAAFQWRHPPAWLEWVVVFIGTFLLVFIPLSIISHRLSAMVRQSEIGPVDRVLGLVFGIARGLVIVGLAYIAFSALVPLKDIPASLVQARSFPVIRNTSEILRELARAAFLPAITASHRTKAPRR
jgi:membrane protein required for colicin V production